jgi:hypothetical protein
MTAALYLIIFSGCVCNRTCAESISVPSTRLLFKNTFRVNVGDKNSHLGKQKQSDF